MLASKKRETLSTLTYFNLESSLMRKNLLAKSIATMISGFALVGGAHAVIVANPTAPAGVGPATTLEVNPDHIGHSLL